jgi:hypothetical protein
MAADALPMIGIHELYPARGAAGDAMTLGALLIHGHAVCNELSLFVEMMAHAAIVQLGLGVVHVMLKDHRRPLIVLKGLVLNLLHIGLGESLRQSHDAQQQDAGYEACMFGHSRPLLLGETIFSLLNPLST